MDAYIVAISIITLIYILLSIGLTLQYGLTGLINFGHVGFFAIGAYASALVSMAGAPIIVGMGAAMLCAAFAAFLIGLATLRLRDDYFAIVTLGFSEVVRIVIISEQWLTNGVQGIPGIPRLYADIAVGMPAQLAVMATILVATIVASRMIHRIARSPFGRTIEAIRDNEEAVQALGKDPARYKIQVLMVGSAFAGLAGAFYAHYVTYIAPDQFVPLVTFYVWMAIIMGGVGRVSGAIVGTAILMTFLEGSRFLPDIMPGIAAAEMGSIRIGVIGVALILFTLYRPQGLMGDYTQR